MKSPVCALICAAALLAFFAVPAMQDTTMPDASSSQTITEPREATSGEFQVAIPTWRLLCSMNNHSGCVIAIDPVTGREYCDCLVSQGGEGGG